MFISSSLEHEDNSMIAVANKKNIFFIQLLVLMCKYIIFLNRIYSSRKASTGFIRLMFRAGM